MFYFNLKILGWYVGRGGKERLADFIGGLSTYEGTDC